METRGIKEVARHAGVSLGTVSNVLNRPHVVAENTRQRVLEAIRELGYVRNDSARQLRAGRSRTIAIVVLDVSNPFFTDVIRGAEEAIEAAGAVAVVCNSGQSVSRERRHLELLEEQRVQGILITPVDGGRDSQLINLIKHGVPVVLVDRGIGQSGRCSVAVDDVLGGRLAGQHFRELGHERVAFVGGPLAIPQVNDRQRGFESVLSDIQVLTFLTAELTVAAGRQAGATIADLPAAERPTAVFCANDLLALGLLQEMTQREISVPGDVAILGYDDIDFAAAAAVPLSSVRQPREQLGRAAAELLLEETRFPETHAHRNLVFHPELVARKSTMRPTSPRR
ncbi:Maltose regulon regulatory protein MalI [Micromonospora noduli]|nr:Maltose regulon regulatory protein MalI [Micromonospora noduli]